MRNGMVLAALALAGFVGGAASAQETSEGQALFEANCAVCHGAAAAGSGKGPPLVHRLYIQGHHGDESFQRAVAQGIWQHHWRFGEMPPVAGVSREDVEKIVAFVRKVQRDAGIE